MWRGENVFNAPLNSRYDCLIYPKDDLTVKGSGTLTFRNGANGTVGAVIYVNHDIFLEIGGKVTLSGRTNGMVHGYALFLKTGTTTINGGTFEGHSEADYSGDLAAVYAREDAELTVNSGGTLSRKSTN